MPTKAKQKYDVLSLLEGMDEKQVKQFKAAIIPTLQELRREIVTANTSNEKTSGGKSDAMHSNSNQRQAM